MGDIDWSKAPEGFDFYIPWSARKGGFYRDGGGRYFGMDGGYAEKEDLKRLAINVICRPWNGEGLPPVGEKVEVIGLSGGYLPKSIEDWKDGDKVECVAHHAMQGDDVTPVFFNKRTFQFSGLRKDCYRPIRTPEQIAAEERENYIKKMLGEPGVTSDDSVADFTCAALYDAGYRKQK